MSEAKNQLETLLEQAATEPAYRPAFFRELLESTVWLPGRAAEEEATDSVPELQHWEKEDGISVIPFFTSVAALQQAISHEQTFVAMPVRTLFEMTSGETLFLNATLPGGKKFTAREISHLLSAKDDALSQPEVIEGGTALLLSEVTEPPLQMVDSLVTLFKNLKNVKRAFLCSVKESSDERPNLLIGIEASGDIEAIIRQVGRVASDRLPEDEPVDICPVTEGEQGIGHFMIAHITPFYERRWGSFLRDFRT